MSLEVSSHARWAHAGFEIRVGQEPGRAVDPAAQQGARVAADELVHLVLPTDSDPES